MVLRLKWFALGALLCLGVLGCLGRPIRTDSDISLKSPVLAHFTNPLRARFDTPLDLDAKLKAHLEANIDKPIKLDFPANSNDRPIVAMPVDSKGPTLSGPYVAVLDVDGFLINLSLSGPYSSGDNVVDIFVEKLDFARNDPKCVALVIRLNSAGGAATATDILWQKLIRFKHTTKKPVVGCIMDMGCSGGYYLMTACDHIIAHPTSIIGGLEVLLNLKNFHTTVMLKGEVKFGDKELFTTEGELTQFAEIGRPIGGRDAQKQALRLLAQKFHMRFKEVVKKQRSKLKADDPTLFDGRVFSAEEALNLGLIDEVAYLQDAINLARNISKHPQTRVALLHRVGDDARTPFATTTNVPLGSRVPLSDVASIDRSRFPTILYLWQPD